MNTLQPEDLLRWRSIGQLALRPDASQVAFVEMWADGDENTNAMSIFIAPTDGSAPPRRLTSGDGDSSPKWSPDGRYLAFASAREKDWRRDLYVLDMEHGGDARLAVTLPRGVGEYAWSPDSGSFALTGRPPYPDDANRPTEDEDERRTRYGQRVVKVDRLHYRTDAVGIVEDEQPAVWVAPLDGSAEPRIVVEPAFPLSNVGWSPDGRITFISRRDPDHEFTWHDRLYAVSPDGGDLETLVDAPGGVLSYGFGDDGSITYSHYPVSGFTIGCYDDRLVVNGKDISDLLDGMPGKHVLADTVDPVGGSSTPTTAGSDVYLQVSRHGAVGIVRYVGGSVETLVDGNRVIGEFGVAGDVLVFTSTSPTDPATLRAARADGSDERVIYEPNPWVHELDVASWEEIWVEVEGVRAQAWIQVPKGATGPVPTVLAAHGGPHAAYGWAFNILLQMIGGQGWAIIFGNPPGSLTYGEDFTQLTHGHWGEADHPLCMAYVDEAIARGIADPDRLAMQGASYGGFLTLWAIAHEDRFKAAVAQRGVSNLDSIFASSEFGWVLMHPCFGSHPWEDPELYRRLSPLTYAQDMDTPLRLVGCTTDQRVAMEQVEQAYIRLKVMGKEVDLVVFQEGHHLVYHGRPWSRIEHGRVVNEWLSRYL